MHHFPEKVSSPSLWPNTNVSSTSPVPQRPGSSLRQDETGPGVSGSTMTYARVFGAALGQAVSIEYRHYRSGMHTRA